MEDAELCSYCKQFDFEALVRGDADAEKDGWYRSGVSYSIGSTRDLVERKDKCPLCHIFASCLGEAFDGSTPLDVSGSIIKCEVQETPVACLPGPHMVKSAYQLSLILEVETEQSSEDGIEPPELSVDLRFQAVTRTLVSDLAYLKPAEPRPRPLQCDFQQLRTWLAQCEKEHGPRCSISESHDTPCFRLIDVNNRCIISASSLPALPRYIALSYVWGSNAQKWRLSVASLEAACGKGFLDNVPLARTISDAMELVRQLKVRFLWVDSICILQDSEEEKLQQIPRMDSVYEQALVTIIAASAKDASGGLPGVLLGTRSVQPHVFQTQELYLVSTIETELWDHGSTNYWPIDDRKWTFQESVLSRRSLYFSQEQVYWQCRRTAWSEEMLIQPTHESTFANWIIWSLHRRGKARNIHAFTGGSGDHFVTRYCRLVQAFTNRSCTYPTDSLDAFQGLLSLITRLTATKFLWAVPEPGIEFFLLWDYDKSSVYLRRNGRSGTTGFPSWSWVAWDSCVRTPGKLEIQELVCYILDCVGACSDLIKTPVLRANDSNKWTQMEPKRSAQSYDLIYTVGNWKDGPQMVTTNEIAMLYVTAPLVGRFHLFFWTSLARLFVCHLEEKEEEEEEEEGEEEEEEGEEEGGEIEKIGIFLPKRKDTLPCAELTIVDCASDENSAEVEPGLKVGGWSKCDGPTQTVVPGLRDFIVVGTQLSHARETLMIMMISWKDGIASREQLTTVGEADWMEAARAWRLIVLG